jgi:serine/threonine-protein kinase RsbW
MDNKIGRGYILKLNSDLNFIETLDDFLIEVCQLKDIPKTLYKKIFLCISEGLSNAIVHGNKGEFNKLVKLELTLLENICEISIEDEGEGFDFLNLHNPTKEENRTKEWGRGLYIVKMYSDEVSFSKNGSVLTMKFLLNE